MVLVMPRRIRAWSRYSQFAYDYMAAAHWALRQSLGRSWGEYHWVVGTANLQALDNVGRKEADRWSILALMAGYTFWSACRATSDDHLEITAARWDAEHCLWLSRPARLSESGAAKRTLPVHEQFRRFGLVFDALLIRSGEELSRLASQLGSSLSTSDRQVARFDDSTLSAELQATLTRVEFRSPTGAILAAWNAPGAPTTEPPGSARALSIVRDSHRPVSLLDCASGECALYEFAPTLDRDGREIVAIVGQSAADFLVSFQRLTGADVALYRPYIDEGPEGTPLVLTHAQTLGPMIRSVPLPLQAQQEPALTMFKDRAYLMQRHALPDVAPQASAPTVHFSSST